MFWRLKASQEIREYTQNYIETSSVANRGEFDGEGREQFAGILAENIIRYQLGFPLPSIDPELTDNGGYDLMIRNQKIDVKTMIRTSDHWTPEHWLNVSKYQLHRPCDYYLFCGYCFESSILTIVGIIKKEDFMRESKFVDKGEPCGIGSFVAKAPMNCIQVKRATWVENIGELEELCESKLRFVSMWKEPES